jgi:nitrogen fixation NifU-like protein
MNEDELEMMYQEFILETSRNPHGKVASIDELSGKTATLQQNHESCVVSQSHQFNPTCGDEVTVQIEVSPASQSDEQKIESIRWSGQGCSISQASLSVMTDMVTGLTIDEFTNLEQTFHKLMNSRGKGLDDEEEMNKLGDATSFQGVSKYPMRIKCALLGWAAVKDSLAKALC